MPKKSTNATKKLIGSDHPDRIKPEIETEPVSAVPSEGLDCIAAQEWSRVTAEMAANGLITALDSAVLAGYCLNYSRFRRAEAAIAHEGEIIYVKTFDTHRNPVSEKPMRNPQLQISESAQRLMSRFADQLGLSPSGRSRLGVEHKAPQSATSLLEMMKKERGE
jgi:P27 family predicted phage terminase small subunit